MRRTLLAAVVMAQATLPAAALGVQDYLTIDASGNLFLTAAGADYVNKLAVEEMWTVNVTASNAFGTATGTVKIDPPGEK